MPNEPEQTPLPHDEAAVMHEIRDCVIELVEIHAGQCTDPGCLFQANLIAFLAHAVGLKSSAAINAMESLLDKYNHECPHCTSLN